MGYCYTACGIVGLAIKTDVGSGNVYNSPAVDRRPGRAASRDTPEHSPTHQASGAGIIEVEQTAEHFSGREQPRNHAMLRIQDLRFGRDLEAAEGEGDAAGHRIGFERWVLDRHGPVRFR